MPTTLQPTDALLVIDLQNDFCPGGSLAVTEGDAIIPLVNRLAQRFPHVILTQDWHPAQHISFSSTHPGTQPYQQIEAPYGPQTLWPDHCLQHSEGAAFHPALDIPHAELILRKGFRKEIDSYSAFLENDHTTPTGLAGYLRERGLTRLFLCGLAYDFCVRYSALDGKALGFETIVIEDATRPVSLPGSVDATNAALAAAGIPRIQSSSVPRPVTEKELWPKVMATVTACEYESGAGQALAFGIPTSKHFRISFNYWVNGELHTGQSYSATAVPQGHLFPVAYNPLAPHEHSHSASTPAMRNPLLVIGIAGSVILSLIWLAVLRGCNPHN